MRNIALTNVLLPAISVLGLAIAALPSYALTTPALKIDSGVGSVTIDGTGAQTYTGICTAVSCPGVATVSSGSISWSGTIGDFSISTLNGRTKPALTSPNIDLGVAAIGSGAVGGTLTISFTDTGFLVGSSPATMNIVSGAVGSALYTSYVDNGNVAFGTGTKVGTATTGGILMGLGPTATPFSMTNVEVLTLPVNMGVEIPPFNDDFSLQAAPNPPLTLGCGVASGQVNVAYNSGLVANGGASPYNFSVIAGSLPGGLSLNPMTGVISGTPNAAATFAFTAQVVDSSGNAGANTVSTSCGIVIAPPPPPALTLTCPSVTAGQVGSAYNSSLVALGGVNPYTFSIVGGALPTGLTLNAATGGITSNPTASGPFNFMAKVVDSARPRASATTSCSITIAAAPVGSIGDRVWSDTNANGVQDTGEPGLTGWSVSLKNSAGATVGTTSTGVNGAYSFGNLAAGTYTVCVSIQVNFTETADLDALSTPNCATGVLTSGQNRTDFDFGYVPVAQAPSLTLACATGTAEVGAAYNSAVVPTGGFAPYVYSLATGALPAGLTLNTSTGAITGSPTTAGTSAFTIKVVDSKGTVAYSICTGTCSGGIAATLNFNSATGSLGSSRSYTIGSTSITAYGFTNSGAATTLHGQNNSGTSTDGLGIDSVYNDQIDTTHFVQIDLSKAVAAGATNGQILISGLNQCQNGESYDIYGSNTLGSIGTQLITAGTKDSTFFAIPSFGTYKYISIRAHGGNVLVGQISFTLPTTCSIKVAAALNVKCPASTATIGRAYTSSVGLTGGAAPYTFSVSWGKLPNGLSLNTSTGVITGTPTTDETAAFKIKVVDAAGVVDYTDCSGSCSSGTTVNYNLVATAGELGASHIYTTNALPLTAWGFINAGAPASLYVTNYNGSDYSLGIKGGSNQIDSAHFVQFDISSLKNLGATSASIWVNSVSWGTAYDVLGSNTLGSPGTLLVNDATKGGTYLSIPNFGSYRYISVRAQKQDVLVGGLTFTYPCTCAIDVNKY